MSAAASAGKNSSQSQLLQQITIHIHVNYTKHGAEAEH